MRAWVAATAVASRHRRGAPRPGTCAPCAWQRARPLRPLRTGSAHTLAQRACTRCARLCGAHTGAQRRAHAPTIPCYRLTCERQDRLRCENSKCLLPSTISNATASLVQSEPRFETVEEGRTLGRHNWRVSPRRCSASVQGSRAQHSPALSAALRRTQPLQAVLWKRTVAEAADEHTLPIEPLHATATAH